MQGCIAGAVQVIKLDLLDLVLSDFPDWAGLKGLVFANLARAKGGLLELKVQETSSAYYILLAQVL